MKKKTLRTLGLGFLCSGILTGAFAIFGQGHSPIPGITVNSLFNQNSNNNQELTKYREEVSKLQEINAKLEAEKSQLVESISSLENVTRNESTTTSSAITATSTRENENSTAETTTSAEEMSTEVVNGTFTIAEGDVSSTIAQNLEAEGYIDSATELQDLISAWDLDAMIVAGSYELNSDMSVHQIAEIITQGAYYYIP